MDRTKATIKNKILEYKDALSKISLQSETVDKNNQFKMLDGKIQLKKNMTLNAMHNRIKILKMSPISIEPNRLLKVLGLFDKRTLISSFIIRNGLFKTSGKLVNKLMKT